MNIYVVFVFMSYGSVYFAQVSKPGHHGILWHRQLVSPGGYRPPDPPPCLSSKGSGHTRMVGPQQNAWSFSISRFTSHTRVLGPSV